MFTYDIKAGKSDGISITLKMTAVVVMMLNKLVTPEAAVPKITSDLGDQLLAIADLCQSKAKAINEG